MWSDWDNFWMAGPLMHRNLRKVENFLLIARPTVCEANGARESVMAVDSCGSRERPLTFAWGLGFGPVLPVGLVADGKLREDAGSRSARCTPGAAGADCGQGAGKAYPGGGAGLVPEPNPREADLVSARCLVPAFGAWPARVADGEGAIGGVNSLWGVRPLGYAPSVYGGQRRGPATGHGCGSRGVGLFCR